MSNSNQTNYKILDTRSQYKRCRIRVPDLPEPLPAIQVDDKYYSLLKVVPDRQKALTIAERLIDRGDAIVIVKTPKGDAIWVWESDAYLLEASSGNSPAANPPVELTNYQILEPHQYKRCHVRVPDLEKRLAALKVDDLYYSFFKVLPDRENAEQVISQLQNKGDRLVVTQTPKGYAIWVLEPEAY